VSLTEALPATIVSTVPMDALLRPQSIALVGASDTSRGGWAERLYDNLALMGFPARLYLINPNRAEVWGRKCYPDFAALPEPVDLALTVIPSAAVPATLREACAHGLRSAIVYAAEFGEGGDEEGAARARALLDLRARFGLRLCGPNCMGLLSLRERLLLYPTGRIRGVEPGPIGLVFQSGGTFQYWLEQASVRGLGFSYCVSSGNELDLDLADYLDFMIADDNTKIIVCLVEGIRRPAAFMAAAARALALGKPILVLKSGRSERGKAAAMSHTGALAGDDEVFNALCRRYGIVRCRDLDELMETCVAFAPARLPKGHRMGFVTVSGATNGLIADYASEEGAALATLGPQTLDRLAGMIAPGLVAGNPLDVGAANVRHVEKFAEICKIVVSDPEVDMLGVLGQLPTQPDEAPDPAIYAGLAAATEKPIMVFGRLAQNVSVAARDYQKKTGLPFVQGVPAAIHAMQALAIYAGRRAHPSPLLPPPTARALPEGAPLDALLAAHGLTPPRSANAATPEAAGACAADIGFPVALKVVSPDISHKTEAGGVAIGLADRAAVSAAAKAMQASVLAQRPGARIDGFLVQEMASGLEFIVGARTDPLYGPFVVLGLGGVTVEVLNDTAIALLPVEEQDVRALLASRRSAPLLGSFRGRPARDVDALVGAVLGLSRLFLDHRSSVSDIEVNPLMVGAVGQGVRAVDVRVVRAPTRENA
jgi:acetate---CoA ligase (ADP-forming)